MDRIPAAGGNRTILDLGLIAFLSFFIFGGPLVSEPNPVKILTDRDLVVELRSLEEGDEGRSAGERRATLESFARRLLHRTIRVSDAEVVAVYERDWLTRPYFALDYDRDGYIFLDSLDPQFQERLSRHSFWASAARTVEGRQLMFELALEERDFEGLRAGCRISLSCELAAVIRGGKSVYCRVLSIEVKNPDPS
jgi:hypothetical protein